MSDTEDDLEDMLAQEEAMRKEETAHREKRAKLESDVEEECPDVVESEIAMMEIMKEVYISAIIEEEPEGEA